MKSPKLKVLQVGKFFFPDKGGIETVTKDIFDGFIGQDYQNDILCFKRKPGTYRKTYGHSFVLKCGSFFYLASTPVSFTFLYWFAKLRNCYDILHIHCPNPIAAIAVFLFPVKGKVIVHWHSDVITHKFLYYFYRFVEKRLLARAEVILTTSPVYAKTSEPLQPYINKCDTLLLSVDENKFRINRGRVIEIKERFTNKKIIFSLGRYVYYKGYEYLIEAAKTLPDDYVVLIGGGGPLKQKFKQMISNYNLHNKVHLIPDIHQDDIGNYYQACDVFCLPSCEKTEAFGIVMLEAMMFSKPIVATNVKGSGVPWVNAHEVSGLNVESKNPSALAEGILQIMNGNYDRFCQNSRNRYEELFTNKKMLLKLHNIYAQLLNHEPRIERSYRVKAS